MCDCVPLMKAGAGTHQICPLRTVERHFVPNVHFLSQIRGGGDAKCLAQGRDFWLLVILAAAEKAVDEF